jgi:DNA repair protein RecN (Recombination protein N)
MLTLIRISNYAIIDDLEIELVPGFSVMTGETGAGKSILVDAVGLALGDRAESGTVRSGTKRADISLVFEVDKAHPARAWLGERELDDDELCCLRRSISAEGRSRAFINNQPVALKDLREIGELLVDIHGQHAHQSLLQAPAQRQLLDSYGGLDELGAAVAAASAEFRTTNRELDSRLNDNSDREAQLETLRFQLRELEELGLAPGEPEILRHERARLKNVDQLRQSIGLASECLYESDSGSAHAFASRARQALEEAAEHDAALAPLLARVASAEIELKEAGGDLSRMLDRLEADPQRLDEVESRLDRVRLFARRHRVNDDEVPALAPRLGEAIEQLDTSAGAVAALEDRCRQARQRFDEFCGTLSQERQRAARELDQAVTARLHELGLPNAEFSVRIAPKAEGRADSTGIDQIEFLVRTNPGEQAGPIQRVASGGELSRIGLALAVAGIDAAPPSTLVFDEVDAGIGGAVAEVVGRRLRQIAGRHQVLCVTHLPQVASQGEQHYRIVKLSDGQSSRTQVRGLDAEQRIDELSRMLGGVDITETTRAHAREMIRQAAGN